MTSTTCLLGSRSRKQVGRQALLTAFGVASLVSLDVRAAAAGYTRDFMAGPILARYVTIPAGATATIETTNLRVNASTVDVPDTVLHVLEAGVQIAGNDDCAPADWRSCVTIPASSSTRSVIAYVRAYNDSRFGQANLRTVINGTVTSEDFHFGGRSVYTGPLSSGAWVQTVQQNGGFDSPARKCSTDTLLFVANGASVVGFSDDEGLGSMSKLRTTAACSWCQVVVGDYTIGINSQASTGASTVIWSDSTTDSDADGLPDAVEQVTGLGLSPTDNDTDRDGIDDGAEVLGIEQDGWLNYPYYGADPRLADLFLEVDYYNSTPWTGADAEELARAYRVNGFRRKNGSLLTFADLNGTSRDARDVRIHLDIGRTNPALDDTRFVWNHWGGSQSVSSADFCTGLSPARTTWHHLISGAGNTASFGRCGLGTAGLTNAPHELGHQLGLNHGGSPNPGPNGSMIYPSIMNYQFSRVGEDPAFSTKRWGSPFNPSGSNETTWAPSGANLIDYIAASFTPARYTNGANWIDFNSDNSFYDGRVVGSATVGHDVASANQFHWNSGGVNTDVEVAWLPATSSSRPPKLFFFHLYTKGSTSRIDYRTSTSAFICDNKQASYLTPCKAFTSAPITLAGTNGVKRFMGVERLKFGSTWKLLITFVDSSNKLRYSIMDASGASAVYDVPSGTGVATGPGVVRLSDTRALLLAAVGTTFNSQLFAWEYDTAQGWTSNAVPQVYDDGSAMMASTSGISMTQGYFADTGTTKQLVGALADGNLIKVVRYDASSRNWQLLSGLNASANGGRGFWSDSKIAIAYVPYAPKTAAPGRYFLAYSRPDLQSMSSNFLVRTYGDDPNATVDSITGLEPRALKWRLGGTEEYADTEWDHTTAGSGVELLYDLDYDYHLRGGRVSATWSESDGSLINSVTFWPFADGGTNVDITDYDDWPVIKNNLRCSLGKC